MSYTRDGKMELTCSIGTLVAEESRTGEGGL